MERPIRIGNFSGFLGDRFSALDEILSGGEVDVVMGDYLAEATMAGVTSGFRGREDEQRNFYASYFLDQLRPQLPAIGARGVKVVVNAGAFNPAGLAEQVRELVADAGLGLVVAHVEGDDVTADLQGLQDAGQLHHLDTGAPLDLADQQVLMANAYLGGWGVAAALREGADIVIAGRVADASLVSGPAAWWHDWSVDDWGRIAGAVAAGHIIECGPQPAGGNFSGFDEIPDPVWLGFPIAEVAADGSSVITKHPGTGGAVTVDTVAAQLLYEIQGPHYLNPDVVVHMDTIRLAEETGDRVRVSGVTGSAAPETTKVGIFTPAGYKGSFWGFVTGTRADEKLALLEAQVRRIADGLGLTGLRLLPCGRPAGDPASQWAATMPVYIAAAAETEEPLRRLFAGFLGLGLSSIPGFYLEGSGISVSPRSEYVPGLVPQSAVEHTVVLPGGKRISAPTVPGVRYAGQAHHDVPSVPEPDASGGVRLTLGELVHGRSSDKGANSDLGVWARDPDATWWLTGFLTTERLRQLLNEPEDVIVERYELPNLHGVYFVLRGHLGTSGSSNLDPDVLSKALSEFLRARVVTVPAEIAALGR